MRCELFDAPYQSTRLSTERSTMLAHRVRFATTPMGQYGVPDHREQVESISQIYHATKIDI